MEILREMKEILREKMEILRKMKEIFRIEIYQIALKPVASVGSRTIMKLTHDCHLLQWTEGW